MKVFVNEKTIFRSRALTNCQQIWQLLARLPLLYLGAGSQCPALFG